jgi:hypothetical protein
MLEQWALCVLPNHYIDTWEGVHMFGWKIDNVKMLQRYTWYLSIYYTLMNLRVKYTEIGMIYFIPHHIIIFLSMILLAFVRRYDNYWLFYFSLAGHWYWFQFRKFEEAGEWEKMIMITSIIRVLKYLQCLLTTFRLFISKYPVWNVI